MTRWIAGYNVSGYMPEAEPLECDTWQEARDALLFDLERCDFEDATLDAQADAAIAFLSSESVEGCEVSTATVNGYLYWIEAAPVAFGDVRAKLATLIADEKAAPRADPDLIAYFESLVSESDDAISDALNAFPSIREAGE